MRGAIKGLLGHPGLLSVAASRAAGTLLVLMYHDLRQDDDFGNWLRVRVSDFEEQLAFLGRLGRFVGPDAIADPDGLAPDRLNILVTFDDGYVNNHRLALPVLARRRVPALFFVSTDHLLRQHPFWPDLVVTPIQARRLTELDLREFQLGIHRFRPADGPGRWDDIQRLLVAIKEVGNADHPMVAGVLDHLRSEFQQDLADHLPRFRPANETEVRDMAASGWCHFGSHGHGHDILTYLSDEDLDFSLRESRRVLSAVTGGAVRDLAYPDGGWDERVAGRAGAAGYECAYTTASGLVTTATAAMARPRLGVGGFESMRVLRYRISRVLFGRRGS